MRHMSMGLVLVGLISCGATESDSMQAVEASDYCAEVAATMCEDIAVDCFGEYDPTTCSTFAVTNQCCQVWGCAAVPAGLTRGDLDVCVDDLHSISCDDFGKVPDTCY